MAGADATSSENNPRLCPNCGSTYQGRARLVKCGHCGHYVKPMEVSNPINAPVEQPDPLSERIGEWIAEVMKGEKS